LGKQRGDGTGSVYRVQEGWIAQVRYYDEARGESVKLRRRARNRDEARELLKTLRGDALAASAGDPDATVAGYLSQWRDTTLPRRGLAPSTVHQYSDLIDTILPTTLGQVRLARFTALEAERWLERMDGAIAPATGRPYAQSTKRSAFAVLDLAMQTAVRDSRIRHNPLDEVRRPAKEQAEVPVLTADEVERLIEASRDTDIEHLVVFVANTGVRIGEALALSWDCVDLDRASARIRRATTKTSAGRRTIPLIDDVVAALHRQRAEQLDMKQRLASGWVDNGLVFTTRLGTEIDAHNARRSLRRVLLDAGLPATRPWHTMRHSLATRLLNRGVPMPVVAAILGHASIRTTVDIYGHEEPAISAAALKQAMH